MINRDDMIFCIVDSAAGQYMPQEFVKRADPKWLERCPEDDVAIVRQGPDHPDYCDTWTGVMDRAEWTDSSGHTWSLWQDMDLFAIRDDLPEDDELFG
jgi:hypothetical protein